MADICDKYGNLVYRLQGDRINDAYGNWLYTIVGDHINDTYGNWKYAIRGEYLFDTYGNRLGEMKNLAELLENPKASSSSVSSYENSPSRREKPSGCLGWLFFIIGGWFAFIFRSNWGGKIGLIIGVVLTIISFIFGGEMPAGNYLILGIFIPLLLGTIGAAIGGIVRFIMKLANKNK